MATGLQRTFGTPTDNKIFTLSLWLKRAANSTDSTITLLQGGGSSRPTSEFVLNSEALALSQYDGSSYNYNVRAYYKARDVSAWYHIVYTFDSTQATASDRVKFYMNGVLQNYNMQNTDYPSLNYVPAMNNATNHAIGGSVFGGFSASAECIMSHIHFIDGTAYDATAFGEYDANGVWKIKTSPSVTYGNNGFFILKDGNSVTDQSGNGNNFTVGGGTLTNTEDNPSNVFATLNPLVYLPNLTYSNGNNKANMPNPGYETALSTLGISSGKWYWEAKITFSSNGDQIYGIANENITPTQLVAWWGSNPNAYGIYATSGNKITSGINQAYGDSFNVTGDIISTAFDADNGTIWFGKNGVWQNSATQTEIENGTTTNSAFSSLDMSKTYFPAFCIGNTNAVDLNFGNGYFGTTAVASAGTNASGIGIFEYDVPTGYTALSTKGLNL